MLMNEWSWGSIFGQIQIGVYLADSLMAMQQEPIYIRSIFEFACVLQKGTTSRESFDATKCSHFFKKGTTLSFGCKCQGTSPQNMPKNMVQSLHFILKFPLKF